MIKIGTLLWRPRHRWSPLGEWVSCRIKGETARSWLVEGEREKVSKETLRTRRDAGGVATEYYTKIEMENLIWVKTHCWKIAGMVQACEDITRLRNIAREVGYDDRSRP
jgi:hypothetical protein